MAVSTAIPKGAKRLRTITICGARIPVYRVEPGMLAEMGEDFGQCDFNRLCIFVRSGQHPTQERDTIMHECVHMFLHQSGLRQLLESACKTGDFVAFEETIVRVATPHLVGYLK